MSRGNRVKSENGPLDTSVLYFSTEYYNAIKYRKIHYCIILQYSTIIHNTSQYFGEVQKIR